MWLIRLAAVGLVGCAPGAGAEERTTAADRLVAGAVTFDAPHVGSLLVGDRGCTGTLVAHAVVLTAHHCVQGLAEGTPGDFLVVRRGADGRLFSALYQVRRWSDAAASHSLATGVDGDLALVELTEPVPPSVAAPARVAAVPTAGAGARYVYGAGGDGIKRRLALTDSPGAHGVGGDSGGPLFNASCQVEGVLSARGRARDGYADAVRYREWIRDTASRWGHTVHLAEARAPLGEGEDSDFGGETLEDPQCVEDHPDGELAAQETACRALDEASCQGFCGWCAPRGQCEAKLFDTWLGVGCDALGESLTPLSP